MKDVFAQLLVWSASLGVLVLVALSVKKDAKFLLEKNPTNPNLLLQMIRFEIFMLAFYTAALCFGFFGKVTLPIVTGYSAFYCSRVWLHGSMIVRLRRDYREAVVREVMDV